MSNPLQKRLRFGRELSPPSRAHTKELTQPSSFPCSRRNIPQVGISAFEKDWFGSVCVRTFAVCRRADDARPLRFGGQALFAVRRLSVTVSVRIESRGTAVSEISGGTAPFAVSATGAASASRRTGNGRVEAPTYLPRGPRGPS